MRISSGHGLFPTEWKLVGKRSLSRKIKAIRSPRGYQHGTALMQAFIDARETCCARFSCSLLGAAFCFSLADFRLFSEAAGAHSA
jgi:hypothetical protein